MADDTLPPAQAWWPHLSIEAKHELSGALDDALPADVVTEIETQTSAAVPSPAYLSDEDKQFIAEQGEVVD